MEDKVKIQALADIIQSLLQQVDLFTATLNEKDFENLKNIFCSVYNWSELEEELNCYYNIVGDGE